MDGEVSGLGLQGNRGTGRKGAPHKKQPRDPPKRHTPRNRLGQLHRRIPTLLRHGRHGPNRTKRIRRRQHPNKKRKTSPPRQPVLITPQRLPDRIPPRPRPHRQAHQRHHDRDRRETSTHGIHHGQHPVPVCAHQERNQAHGIAHQQQLPRLQRHVGIIQRDARGHKRRASEVDRQRDGP